MLVPWRLGDLRFLADIRRRKSDCRVKGAGVERVAIGEPMLVPWRPGDLRSLADVRRRKLDLRRVGRLPLDRLPPSEPGPAPAVVALMTDCLLYTSDAADE